MTANNSQIERIREQKVARPLSTIYAEVKSTYTKGKTAAYETWRPFEEHIGLLLLEAKTHFGPRAHGFKDSFNRQGFEFSFSSANRYMGYAEKLGELPDFIRHSVVTPTIKPPSVRSVLGHKYQVPEWRDEFKKLHEEAAARAPKFLKPRRDHEKEDKLVQALALRIIDAGFKVLSTTMHPDKGGSVDGMRRLNAARAKLKHAIRA